MSDLYLERGKTGDGLSSAWFPPGAVGGGGGGARETSKLGDFMMSARSAVFPLKLHQHSTPFC